MKTPLIRLVFVVHSLNSGGTEQHLLHLLSQLNSARFRASIFTLRDRGTLFPIFSEAGIVVHRSDSSRALNLIRLTDLVSREKPLVHLFLPEPYIFGGIVSIISGAPIILMSRRSRNHYQSRHPVAAWLERRLHKRMDALLGNSRAVVQDLIDEGAPPDRVRLIYNGIDTERFPLEDLREDRRAAMRAGLGLPDDWVVLICIANLFPYKGHADLLEALALLGANVPARPILLVVGRDAGARAALEAQTAQLGLSETVYFLGERHDIPDLLAASDVGVLASHEEGFSNAVIEGMAAGLPMVVSNVGGNAEAVVDGECGYVVPARDPAALAKALALLIDDAGRRQSMGEAGRKRVVAEFSIEACVSAYESLYEELWERRLSTLQAN